MDPHTMTRLIAIALLLILLPLQACDSKPANKFDNIIQVEILTVTPVGGDYVGVRYKVTNISAEHIVRAKTNVTVFDGSGAEMASKDGHYVVRGAAGGLKPGASSENEVVIKVKDKTKAASAKIEIDYIRDGAGAKIVADDSGPSDPED